MRITIDTKHDTPEEIRRVITLLSEVVGKNSAQPAMNNLFGDAPANSEQPSPEISGLMGLFDGPAPSTPTQQTPPPTDFGLPALNTPQPEAPKKNIYRIDVY